MSRKQRYGKIKLEAFLATRGGENVGVYRKKNGKYVVSIYTVNVPKWQEEIS